MINRLSRRDLLRSVPLCSALPSVLIAAPPRPANSAWEAFLSREVRRVMDELRLYKNRIAPLVVISRYRDGDSRWQFAPDYPRLRSHQVVADSLIQALGDGVQPTGIDEQAAMEEVNDHSSMIDDCVLMNGRPESDLRKRCWLERRLNGHQKLVWNCSLRFSMSSPQHLGEAARSILHYLQGEGEVPGSPIQDLRAQSHEKRLAAFFHMSPFHYVYLMGPLFEMVPLTPLRVFSIGLEQRRAWGPLGENDSGRECPNEEAVFARTSFLCEGVVGGAFCSAVSTLANNHFSHIVRLVRRAEQLVGTWASFIPGEVLSALNQKVMMLNWLRAGGWRDLENN